ncbi:primosome assembly protein PriA [Lentisphaera araneosa HTCC2155]|uniref:Replication restart protein PriA n=1 Tax=Lentisphaera araneosa HTCC2155 TaxID=313628 RepID=A6DK13_9BACT|nr:primosomal protein N' [Lentisphaera araneosa]EDM28237.1 primosome assembly protein PriA [Lentisphaera araneosa HTCC2155]
MPKFARVLPDMSLDKTFDYKIPAGMDLRLGCRVRIPFGRTERTGYVVDLVDKSDFPENRLKAIAVNEGHLIPEKMMQLGQWIADYYCTGMIQSVRNMLPAPVRKDKVKEKTQKLLSFAEGIQPPSLVPELEKKYPPRAAVVKALLGLKEAPQALLMKVANVSASPIKSLLKAGILEEEVRHVERDPFGDEEVIISKPLELTDEQTDAFKLITNEMDEEKPATVVLYGITGSGKTEVYLQAIAEALSRGKQAIVLVPEISLTPQTVHRFRSRFGKQVSVLHSGLSEGERYDQWKLISRGETQIVVGARSALFAPFHNPGIIVVDEEHEPSYKQDSHPRYNARDIAVMRGIMDKCPVVLGSATPSFETMNNANQGKYKMAKLTQRPSTAVVPSIKLVDMRTEAAATGSNQIFSRELIESVKQQLHDRMQTILFLNRRGYSTHLTCEKCQYTSKCGDCSTSHTYHRKSNVLICHLCGDIKEPPTKCPDCGHKDLSFSGLGTEKIERLCRGVFPNARIARMDSDTMTRKDSHKTMLGDFQQGKYDILIGTQMIAKGLHFPRVTLVGVVFADAGLNMADFRAAERTFQLLAQVSGRSGRGDDAGRVLIQTYNPTHPALQCALEGDFDAFYEDEKMGREVMKFPPFSKMVLIHFRGPEEGPLASLASDFSQHLSKACTKDDRLMPAVPSPIEKVRGQYRYQLTIFSDNIRRLVRVLNWLRLNYKAPKEYKIIIDVDPQSLM